MASDRSPDYLSTLAKGLKVLTCFSRENPSMTLSEVAKRTGLNAAVARRCLLTLCDLGYVGKTDSHFTLRPEVLVFASLPNQTVLLGVIDLSTPEVESVETIVSRVKRALPYIDKERIVLASSCGMKYLPREASFQKLCNMTAAAALLRQEFA